MSLLVIIQWNLKFLSTQRKLIRKRENRATPHQPISDPAIVAPIFNPYGRNGSQAPKSLHSEPLDTPQIPP